MTAAAATMDLSVHLAPLMKERRWVLFKYELSSSGLMTKVPYCTLSPQYQAKNSEPATWSDYRTTRSAVQRGEANGFGYQLRHDPNIAAFDLDNCVDNGVVAQWARDLVESCGSYTEYSVSGTGLHIIGTAKGGVVHRNQRVPDTGSRLETYRQATRYLIMSGKPYPGFDVELKNIDDIIDQIVPRLDAANAKMADAGTAVVYDGPPIEPPPALKKLIEDGCEQGERSEKFHFVVCTLKDLGHSVDAIEAALLEHPTGIAEKYHEGRRLRREILRCFEKAKPRIDYFDPSGRPLPVVKVVAGEIARVVDEAEQAIINAGHPVFVRAGELVRPISDEVPAAKGRTTTVAKFVRLNQAAVIDLLARSATFVQFNARVKADVRQDPPQTVAAVLLAREGMWRLPRVSGVITTPTLRPDGTILSAAGYDSATRLYLFPDENLAMPEAPEKPTRGQAESALKLLTDLLSGFPLVDRTDVAVALSGIVTAVIRGAFPVAPMHAIRSHTPGSGKSELVDVAATISTGRRAPVITAGDTPEELEKRLGSMLRDGIPLIAIDNCNAEIGGDSLCQMTERPTVRMRVLGKSETPEFECRATVYATGNNLRISGDMTRRSLLCNLDAHVERPELRKFAFSPVDRVLAGRGQYVAAAMVIARAYMAAGSPPVCDPIGSYGEWSAMVRAPLIWLDQADPVASMETARAEDPVLTAIGELFEHWTTHLADAEPHTSASIARAAEGAKYSVPDFYELIFRVAGSGGSISTKRLGGWLTGIMGRPYDGKRLMVDVDQKRGNRYRLAPA